MTNCRWRLRQTAEEVVEGRKIQAGKATNLC
jgi:hypothetical protein